jgi:hypothetical protein
LTASPKPRDHQVVQKGHQDSDHDSAGELLGRLTLELSQLVRSDLELAAAERGRELRRLAVELAAVLAVAVASLLALIALSSAAAYALAELLPTWAAALVVAGGWTALVVLLAQIDHPRGLLRRLTAKGGEEQVARATRQREDAEQALRQTAERLERAVAREGVEREAHASVERAEELAGRVETRLDDPARVLAELVFAPGKAGLALLELLIGRSQKGRPQP